MLEDVRKAGAAPMPCPYCLQPSCKDDHCDHVTCIYCRNDFCFRCSAKRGPTLEHGNHYHRKECKHYTKYSGEEDQYSPSKCDECKRLNGLCKPPLSLIDGDIPLEEYPTEYKTS